MFLVGDFRTSLRVGEALFTVVGVPGFACADHDRAVTVSRETPLNLVQAPSARQTFGPVLTLSGGSKAEHPTVAIHDSGKVAIGWTEHAFPQNKIIVQQGQLQRVAQ